MRDGVHRVVEDRCRRRCEPRGQPQQVAVQHAEPGQGRLRRQLDAGHPGERPHPRPSGARPRQAAARAGQPLVQHRDELGDRDIGGQRGIDPGARGEQHDPAERCGRSHCCLLEPRPGCDRRRCGQYLRAERPAWPVSANRRRLDPTAFAQSTTLICGRCIRSSTRGHPSGHQGAARSTAADAGRGARARAAARAGPGPAGRRAGTPAAGGDAGGGGRVRRGVGGPRSDRMAVRRHDRAVHARHAGRRRRRGAASRRAEADEDRRDYLRYLQQVRRRVRAVAAEQRAARGVGAPGSGRVAGRAGRRADVGAPCGRSRLRAAAVGSRRAAAGHPAHRAADRAGRRARAGHRAGAAQIAACARRGPRPSGCHRPRRYPKSGTAAVDRQPGRSGGDPLAGQGRTGAVRAAAQPPGRGARRGRAPLDMARVGLGEVAAARAASPRRRTPPARYG